MVETEKVGVGFYEKKHQKQLRLGIRRNIYFPICGSINKRSKLKSGNLKIQESYPECINCDLRSAELKDICDV